MTKSLREFAQFVGKPATPISPRALVEHAALNFPDPLSVRELVQTFDQDSQPVVLEAIAVEPDNRMVPFTAGMRVARAKGHPLGVRWRILLGGQQIAVYEVSRTGPFMPQAEHTFTEPGTYTVAATFRAIGKDGYAEATTSVQVVAQPKPSGGGGGGGTPPQTPPIISVVYDGPAAEASFTVTGSGFVSNHVVHIRVVNTSDQSLPTVFFKTTSDSSGAIKHEINFPCIPGITLVFSANDERPGRDQPTGLLWSNFAEVTVT